MQILRKIGSSQSASNTTSRLAQKQHRVAYKKGCPHYNGAQPYTKSRYNIIALSGRTVLIARLIEGQAPYKQNQRNEDKPGKCDGITNNERNRQQNDYHDNGVQHSSAESFHATLLLSLDWIILYITPVTEV